MSFTSEDSYDFASDSSDGEEDYPQPLPEEVPPKAQAVLGMKSNTSQSDKTTKQGKAAKSSGKPTLEERMAIVIGVILICFGVILLTCVQTHSTQAPTSHSVSYNLQFNNDAYHEAKEKYTQEAKLDRQILEVAEAVNKALEKFNDMTKAKQLMINKWIPVPEKFSGLQEYLQETGKTGTFHDKFMHLARPNFDFKENDIITIGFRYESFAEMERNWAPCPNNSQDYEEKRLMKIIDNAHLTITDTIYKNGKRMVFTRVYRTPLIDLIKLV